MDREKQDMINAYLVMIDGDGEKQFVVFNSTAHDAARLAAQNVDDEPEEISVSLLCDAEHVLGLVNINNDLDRVEKP